jgi:hypothetical protein
MINCKGFGRKRPWPNFKVLYRRSPEGIGENHENAQDTRSPGPDLKPGPPEYETEVLTTRPRI